MNTKLYIGLLASSLFAFAGLAGCGGDTGSTGGGSGTTSSSTTGAGGESSTTGTGGTTANPPAPALGTQIDRFGRPAINTALNHTFDPDMTLAGKAKDTYNAEGDQSKWPALSGAEFAGNLAILDSLDTVCGNQILAGTTAIAGRYAVLAGALGDDRIWLKTDAKMCTTYLAVEANATGLLANEDCGGRKLDYDVIDTSYSALAAGIFAGVGDGVTADADTKGTTFPYLAGPH